MYITNSATETLEGLSFETKQRQMPLKDGLHIIIQ
jgi:hypothetical protein